MSSTALSTVVLSAAVPAKHVLSPLPVYVASTPYVVPIISTGPEQNTLSIAAAVIGLEPMFPVIAEGWTFVIPDFVRITKFPDVPRTTVFGPAATAVPVVKLHVLVTANALPARSLTPVVTVAV